ncbi:DUF1684 domain-containing protein [Pseudarthrobacter sp. J1738]|uniref:DUF1684 domain-containing protein n=1 Tax=unclassified Pseudarthrobacter TaxID=2647000 RepID=UPI003D285240
MSSSDAPAAHQDPHSSESMSALEIADWRLQTFGIYSTVREIARTSPRDAHEHWCTERDRMFREHPASALDAASKAHFTGLHVAAYDPDFRFELPLLSRGAGEVRNVTTGTDGVVPFERLGTFAVPEIGELAVWRLKTYGGGIFVPLRDTTAGKAGGSYGAGRYLLDTIKGSFTGVNESGEFILDFNFAYNPSCAYNEAWACPLPGPDNRLSTAIEAGEMYAPDLASTE